MLPSACVSSLDCLPRCSACAEPVTLCNCSNYIPLTCKRGVSIPAWYVVSKIASFRPTLLTSAPSYRFDILAVPSGPTAPMPTREDQLGMEMATQRIHEIIRDQVEREGIDEDRIVLAGFSQGKSCLLSQARFLQLPA